MIIPTNGFYEHYVKNAHAKILTMCPTAQVIIVDDIYDYISLIANGEAVGLISESMVSFYQSKISNFSELSYRSKSYSRSLKRTSTI